MIDYFKLLDTMLLWRNETVFGGGSWFSIGRLIGHRPEVLTTIDWAALQDTRDDTFHYKQVMLQVTGTGVADRVFLYRAGEDVPFWSLNGLRLLNPSLRAGADVTIITLSVSFAAFL